MHTVFDKATKVTAKSGRKSWREVVLSDATTGPVVAESSRLVTPHITCSATAYGASHTAASQLPQPLVALATDVFQTSNSRVASLRTPLWDSMRSVLRFAPPQSSACPPPSPITTDVSASDIEVNPMPHLVARSHALAAPGAIISATLGRNSCREAMIAGNASLPTLAAPPPFAPTTSSAYVQFIRDGIIRPPTLSDHKVCKTVALPPGPSHAAQPRSAIPRPRNAFIQFRSCICAMSKADGQGEQTAISKVAAELWRYHRENRDKVYTHYLNMAELERRAHASLYPNYQFNPRRRFNPRRSRTRNAEKDSYRRHATISAVVGMTGIGNFL
ncbi:hypothetical protein BKA62DRAFT_777427 [Auriculariales sp. MPI-PUGE-AT-0066]|nr:hypothetical protein BKA62DRAFT_777427 [Auriculariales sp. MPI-PUGE-AT-0066]